MAEVLFVEIQVFRQKWVEGLLLFATLFVFACYFIDVFINGHASREATIGLFITIGAFTAFTFFLKRIKLITQITSEGIQVRFAPLQMRFHLYRWADIEQIFIRTYNPLLEYGGWGLKFGPSGSAYNVSGNVGLQLVLRGNHRVLIGTEKPELLMEVLQRLGRM
jgi:hypothetical protein